MELEKIHRKLLTDISDNMDNTSMEYGKFIEHMKIYVPKGLLAQEKTLLGKFGTMEKRGYLKPGHYDELKQICIDSGNVDILDMIKEAESKIENLHQGTIDGNSEHGSDQKEPPAKKMKYADIEKDLQSDLIEYYREICSTIPICPCLEEVDAPLVKVYTPPFPLYLRETDKLKQMVEQSQQRGNERTGTPSVDSLRKIFNKQSKDCKKIYLTAEPGVGKTSFAKWLALTWCQAHSPDDDDESYLEQNDVSQMKNFDFLFLIFLRETDLDERHIDSMITNHILSALGRHIAYTTDVLAEVLFHKKCLIILDGLDEWSVPGIPLHSTRKNCTYLTTLRPWKFNALTLGSTQIDQHVCIDNVAKICKETIISNVMSLFEERGLLRSDMSNQDEACKLFKSKIDEKEITHFYNIPILIVQLITLWNINKEIGESNCEIYAGIVDTFFSFAEKKVELLAMFSSKTYPKINCFRDSPFCIKYNNLMIRLGKLAFETLFCEQKEFSLCFLKNMALAHLPGDERISADDTLATCLQTGLLSVKSIYVRSKMKIQIYSFLHKTIQEFFAALYIQAEYAKNDHVKDVIKNRCNSVSTVREMATVLTFLSGLDVTIAREVLQSLQFAINEDEIIKTYRRRFIKYWFDEGLLQVKGIQIMIIDCLKESIQSGHLEHGLPLQDIVFGMMCIQDSVALKTLVKINSNNIKSLVLYRDAFNTESWFPDLIYLRLPEMQSLRKLKLYETLFEDPHSSSRLQCASVLNVADQLIGLNTQQLELLHLTAYHSVVHTSIERFLNFVTQQTLLKEVHLTMKCSEHQSSNCTGLQLDLCKQTHLQKLDLSDIPVKQLQVNDGLKTLCLSSVPVTQIQLHNHLQNISLYHVHVSQLQLNEDLKELELSDVPVTELHLNKHLQRLSLRKVPISLIAGNEQLQTLSLQEMSLSQLQLNDQLQSLSLNEVTVSELQLNEYLQSLHLSDISLSELKLNSHLKGLAIKNVSVPQIQPNEHLQQLRLWDVPVTKLQLNEHLHELSLSNVPVTHLLLNDQLQSLSLNKVTLSELQLNEYLQSLHLSDISLSKLHFTQALKRLSLMKTSISKYQGILSSLEFCTLEDLPAGAVAAVFSCLPAVTKLQNLKCSKLGSPDVKTVLDTIPQLLQLNHFTLSNLDLKEMSLVLPNKMEHIEHMDISFVTLTSGALNILVEGVMQYKQSVKVKLFWLKVKDDTIGNQQDTFNPRNKPSNSDKADLSRYNRTEFEINYMTMSDRAFRFFIDTLEKCKRPVVVYMDDIIIKNKLFSIEGFIEKKLPSFVIYGRKRQF